MISFSLDVAVIKSFLLIVAPTKQGVVTKDSEVTNKFVFNNTFVSATKFVFSSKFFLKLLLKIKSSEETML